MAAPAKQPGRVGSAGEPALFDEAFQRRLETLALLTRRVLPGRDRAERRSRRAGQGVELADYRSYAPGDDYRHIDWNAYARTERLMLRLYEQEEDLCVYLLLDCSASMGLGASGSKLVYGKRLAAALAYVALSGLDRVSVSALGTEQTARMPDGRGRARIFSVLQFLKPLQASGQTDLGASITRFLTQHKRRGIAILLSDLYDPNGFEHAVSKLRYARFEPHVIHLIDPAEQKPSLRGDIELRDVESDQTREVTITPALLQRYERAYAAHLARIRGFCADKQVPLHSIAIDAPLEDAVLGILRRGRLLS